MPTRILIGTDAIRDWMGWSVHKWRKYSSDLKARGIVFECRLRKPGDTKDRVHICARGMMLESWRMKKSKKGEIM